MKHYTYKIAICDDSAADAAYVAGFVRQWAADRVIEIKSYPSAEAFLFHYEEEKDFDILLLDIEMGQMDGVSMAKRSARITNPSRSSSSPDIPTILPTAMTWRRCTI